MRVSVGRSARAKCDQANRIIDTPPYGRSLSNIHQSIHRLPLKKHLDNPMHFIKTSNYFENGEINKVSLQARGNA